MRSIYSSETYNKEIGDIRDIEIIVVTKEGHPWKYSCQYFVLLIFFFSSETQMEIFPSLILQSLLETFYKG